MQNRACTKKADTADHLRRNTRRVTTLADVLLYVRRQRIHIIKAIERHQHKECRTNADQNVRAQSGRSVAAASLYTNNTAENCSNNKPKDHRGFLAMKP